MTDLVLIVADHLLIVTYQALAVTGWRLITTASAMVREITDDLCVEINLPGPASDQFCNHKLHCRALTLVHLCIDTLPK